MNRIRSCSSALGILGLLVFISSCEGESASRPTLKVLMWAHYMGLQLGAAFEREFQCRVTTNHFDSNESMLVKIQSGADGNDVSFPSSYMAAIMHQQSPLLPLDVSPIPNLQHLDRKRMPQFSLDPNHISCVPCMLSTTGIGFNCSHIKDPKPSWSFFSRTDTKNRFTLLNDKRETLGANLIFPDFSLNSESAGKVAAACEVVVRWKPTITKFDSDTYFSGLTDGELLAARSYCSNIFQAQGENESVEYFIPQEGASGAINDTLIFETSHQPALAHAFTHFFHQPPHAAKNLETTFPLCPNRGCYPLVDSSLRGNKAIFVSRDSRSMRSHSLRSRGS